ncbi:hypothetical protein E2542_SST24144 [Spatholobus suberectus]|nr:hypothetical protein E2542_SST24144 [Spatholobus suberectus]
MILISLFSECGVGFSYDVQVLPLRYLCGCDGDAVLTRGGGDITVAEELVVGNTRSPSPWWSNRSRQIGKRYLKHNGLDVGFLYSRRLGTYFYKVDMESFLEATTYSLYGILLHLLESIIKLSIVG